MIVLQVRPIHFRVWGCKGSYAGLRLKIKVKCCFCSCAKIRTVYASFVFIWYWSRFFNPKVTIIILQKSKANFHISSRTSKFSHEWDDRPPAVTLHLLLKLRSQVILRISRDKDLRMHGVCCSLHVWDLWWPLMTIVSLLALRHYVWSKLQRASKITRLPWITCLQWNLRLFFSWVSPCDATKPSISPPSWLPRPVGYPPLADVHMA